MVWFGSTIWYGFTFYFKLKFNEINEIMAKMTKYSTNRYMTSLLMQSIIVHNFCDKKVKELNHFFRCITFIMYYLATPGFLSAIYGIQHKDTQLIARIFCIFIILTNFSAVISMNLMSTWITKNAHKPYPLLHSFISRRQTRIPLRLKFKISQFIDRLSGPDIGFYCYDLFPINNYEFYQYITMTMQNYLLLITLYN